jgi:phosphoribosylanthranilate isomerase
MKLKLKICGLREAENIQQVAQLSPDFMGFIFYKKSPRFVSPDFVRPSNISTSIQKIGVFVNEEVAEVFRISKHYNLNGVQLHGSEPVQDCKVLKDSGLVVIKVFSIDDEFDFQSVTAYKSVVDYFLFDTKGKAHGGNGYSFNWKKLAEYDQEIPFFLSGGLSTENIVGVKDLSGMNLIGLDVNSGVEVSPGLKDVSKIESLVKILNDQL